MATYSEGRIPSYTKKDYEDRGLTYQDYLAERKRFQDIYSSGAPSVESDIETRTRAINDTAAPAIPYTPSTNPAQEWLMNMLNSPVNPMSTNAMIDPYVQGLLGSEARAGKTAFDPEAEIKRRSEALVGSVVPAAQATMSRGLEESQRAYQRGGKLSSSSAIYGPGGTMRTSEEYAQNVASALSSGLGTIYGQVGQEALGYEQTAAGERMNAISVEMQRTVANIQSATQQKIANIEAATNLSAQDKQERIAALQNQSAENIAKTYAQSSTDVANIQGQTARDIQAAEFDFRTEDGVKDWVRELNQTATTEAEKNQILRDQLVQDWNKFTMMNESERAEFQKNLDYMYDALDITQDRLEWERDLAKQTLAEQVRQFNVGDENWVKQFQEGVRQFKLNYDDAKLALVQGLEIQRQWAYDTHEQAQIGVVLEVLKDPLITDWLRGKDKIAAAEGKTAPSAAIVTKLLNSMDDLDMGVFDAATKTGEDVNIIDILDDLDLGNTLDISQPLLSNGRKMTGYSKVGKTYRISYGELGAYIDVSKEEWELYADRFKMWQKYGAKE